MPLRSLLIVFLAITAAIPVYGQDTCSGFNSGKVGRDYIHQEFSPAVLKMQDVGTAYLIDSDNGYLLTAGHVLNDLVAKNEGLQVIMGQSPHSRFSFKIVKQYFPDTADVALLQLVPANSMQNYRAFDITFTLPGFDTQLFAMGYPQYGDPSEITLKDGPATYAGRTKGGMIEVNHETEGGDSGGALANEFGDAVAICEQETARSMKGSYLPIVTAAIVVKVFKDIPVSNRMRQLETQIINGQIELDSLKQFLTKTSRNPSNLELFVWTQKLNQSPEFLNKIAPYLTCPIVPAFSERHIVEGITPFMGRLDPGSSTKMNLALAQREYSRGNNQAAVVFAEKSVEVAPTDSTQKAVAFLKQRALLFKGAIEDQKKLGGEIVQQNALPLNVTLDSGADENYLVQWVATIDSQKSETGHPSEPLKGWLTDTRQCHWDIKSEILRKVYYLGPQGQTVTEQSVSKVYSGGFRNEGNSFVFERLSAENCGDANARYESDVKDAHSAVNSLFPNVVREDQVAVQADISRLPHVKGVGFPPAPPEAVSSYVY